MRYYQASFWCSRSLSDADRWWRCSYSTELIFRVFLYPSPVIRPTSTTLRLNWASLRGDSLQSKTLHGWLKAKATTLVAAMQWKDTNNSSLINHTCKLFDRTVPKKEHPLPSKKSCDNLPVDLVVWAKNGVRSNSEYANKYRQYDHKMPYFLDLKLKQHVHVPTAIKASLIPCSIHGPASSIVTAADLYFMATGNRIFKYVA